MPCEVERVPHRLLDRAALDDRGEVITPFSAANCVPVRADKTRQAVTWKGADLAGLRGQAVRFRFYLRHGELYAFWVSPEGTGASHGYVAAGGPGLTGVTVDHVVVQNARLDGIVVGGANGLGGALTINSGTVVQGSGYVGASPATTVRSNGVLVVGTGAVTIAAMALERIGP